MKGLTILSSNGFTNGTPLPDRETMLRLVAEHRKKPASDLVVAYLRVATNMLPSDAQGPSNESLSYLEGHVGTITIIDSDTSSREAEKAINGADLIYAEGGNPSYLLWWLNDRNLVSLLSAHITDAETAYIGSSAGAMILGKSVRMTWFAFLSEGGHKKNRHFMPKLGRKQTRGLEIVPYVVHPHFTDKDMKLEGLERLLFGRILPLWEGTYVIVE